MRAGLLLLLWCLHFLDDSEVEDAPPPPPPNLLISLQAGLIGIYIGGWGVVQTGKSYSFRSCVRASEAVCASGTMLFPWLGCGSSRNPPGWPGMASALSWDQGVRMGGWVTFLCEMTWGLRNDMFRSLVARAVVSQPADPPAKLAK